MATKEQVLKFIAESGETGRTFTEIQKFVVATNGLDWNKRSYDGRLAYRGYWCVNLRGGRYSGRKGILNENCKKLETGKWVIAA